MGLRLRARGRRDVRLVLVLVLRAALGGSLRVRLGATKGGFLGPDVLMLALLGLVSLAQFIVRDRKSRDLLSTDRDFYFA
ncbi:hypothetical protein ROS217_04120 [Roseovarius sp. 217]|nr:hypothetical protein ROS217_04120 [Roseovarius sp. 217]